MVEIKFFDTEYIWYSVWKQRFKRKTNSLVATGRVIMALELPQSPISREVSLSDQLAQKAPWSGPVLVWADWYLVLWGKLQPQGICWKRCWCVFTVAAAWGGTPSCANKRLTQNFKARKRFPWGLWKVWTTSWASVRPHALAGLCMSPGRSGGDPQYWGWPWACASGSWRARQFVNCGVNSGLGTDRASAEPGTLTGSGDVRCLSGH